MSGFLSGTEQRRSLAVGDKVQSAVFDISHAGFVKAQRSLARVVQSFGRDRMALGQAQDALHSAQVTQRILVGQKLIDQLLDTRTELGAPALGRDGLRNAPR